MAKKQNKDQISTALEDAISSLEKTYGKGTIFRLKDEGYQENDIISTGSIGFDWGVLGVGGFVKGRLYEIMGWEGTGKSTLCAMATANTQKEGGVVVYIDGEQAINDEYFKELGVDLDNLYVSQPSNAEEAFSIMITLMKSGKVDLIIIDSDSSLFPKSVAEADAGDSALGRKAKFNSDAYPKLKNALVKNNTCVVVITQYREKLGVMYGSPLTTPGGNALKFYADCRVEISKTLLKNGEDVYGQTLKIRSIKNKLFPPYKRCEFDLIFGKGIDAVSEVFEHAVDYNIITKAGSWYSYGETKLGQGDAARDIFKDNIELYEEVKGKLIHTITEKK